MLHNEVLSSLKDWVCVDTSHSKHPMDERRFYRFVWQYWLIYRKRWDESEIFEALEKIVREECEKSDEVLKILKRNISTEGPVILSRIEAGEKFDYI